MLNRQAIVWNWKINNWKGNIKIISYHRRKRDMKRNRPKLGYIVAAAAAARFCLPPLHAETWKGKHPIHYHRHILPPKSQPTRFGIGWGETEIEKKNQRQNVLLRWNDTKWGKIVPSKPEQDCAILLVAVVFSAWDDRTTLSAGHVCLAKRKDFLQFSFGFWGQPWGTKLFLFFVCTFLSLFWL